MSALWPTSKWAITPISLPQGSTRCHTDAVGSFRADLLCRNWFCSGDERRRKARFSGRTSRRRRPPPGRQAVQIARAAGHIRGVNQRPYSFSIRSNVIKANDIVDTATSRAGLFPGAAWPIDAWVLGCVAFAVLLDIHALSAAPLWFDETLTVLWVRSGWAEMVRAVLADNHVPLYPLLLKAWAAVFGESRAALRSFGIPCHAITVLCIAAVANLANGLRTARFAAFLAAVSPFLVHHAQEARMYALLYALSSASLLVLARFLSGRTRKLGTAFVALDVAMLATHYYALFAIGAQLLVILWFRPAAPRRWLPAVAVVALACAAAVASALLLARHDAGSTYRLGLLALPGMVWAAVGGYALLPDSQMLHAQGWQAAESFLVYALPGAAASLVLVYYALRHPNRRLVAVTGAVVVAAFALPFAVSVVRPAIGLNPRYAATAVPAMFALLAAGYATAPARIGRVAGAVLAACLLIGTWTEATHPGGTREDVDAAGRWLDAHVPVDQPVLVTSHEMLQLASFHWPGRTLVEYPARKVVAGPDNAAQIAAGLPIPPSGGRWIYVFGRAWLSDPDGALIAELRQRYRSCDGDEERGIRILCLTPRDAGQ